MLASNRWARYARTLLQQAGKSERMPDETKGRIAKLDKFTGNDGRGSMEDVRKDSGKWRNLVAALPPNRLN